MPPVSCILIACGMQIARAKPHHLIFQQFGYKLDIRCRSKWVGWVRTMGLAPLAS